MNWIHEFQRLIIHTSVSFDYTELILFGIITCGTNAQLMHWALEVEPLGILPGDDRIGLSPPWSWPPPLAPWRCRARGSSSATSSAATRAAREISSVVCIMWIFEMRWVNFSDLFFSSGWKSDVWMLLMKKCHLCTDVDLHAFSFVIGVWPVYAYPQWKETCLFIPVHLWVSVYVCISPLDIHSRGDTRAMIFFFSLIWMDIQKINVIHDMILFSTVSCGL